jgi:hypothetical protein
VRPTATIVVADTDPGGREDLLVTITFSEAVTGFTNADLTVANGTLSAEQQRRRHHLDGDLHPDRQRHRHHQPDHPGQHRRADLAGNAGSGTTDSNNYAIDTVRPTATIVVAEQR